MCKKPFIRKGMAFGCGQCLPCRANKRRLWTHRIILESLCHEQNAFVTLTYTDDTLPKGGTLVKSHASSWIKRIRDHLPPKSLRVFYVGEYGDVSQRPHYHAMLFGYPSCLYGGSRYSTSIRNCCPNCDLIRDTWGHGLVYVGTLTANSADYIAGYTTKKMTNAKDRQTLEWLRGRAPEFAEQSRNPGLGALYLPVIAQALLDPSNPLGRQFAADPLADVPATLEHGGKRRPLGRFLRQQLRLMTDRGKELIDSDGVIQKTGYAPAVTLAAYEETMRPLRETAEASATINGRLNSSLAETILQNLIIDENAGKVAGFEARYKLFKQRSKV